MLSTLTSPLFALLLSLGGFNYSYAAQTDTNGTATVEVTSEENIKGLKVIIKGDDGSGVEKSINVKPGKPTKVTWKQNDRQVNYTIRLESSDAYTSGEFEIIRPIAGGSQGAFSLLSNRNEIVNDQKIRYKTPFTMSSHELQVFNTDGDMIVENLVTDKVIEAGQSFELTWRHPDEVFMVKVTGSDDTGFSYTDTRVPWAANIPHTEVNFDSAKWDIKPDEEWKVAEAFAVLVHELAGIDRANEAVNGDIKLQLYIVGYTDTVGDASDNQTLSENRAKEIANYFKDKGAWCEIYYAGMGERGLAVKTDDSVDEVRNRRAAYILSPQTPAGGGHIPGKGAWKKVAESRPRTLNTLPELPPGYIAWKEKQRAERVAKWGDGGGDGDGGVDYSLGGDDDGGDGDSSGSGGGSSSGGDGGSSGGDDGGPPSVGGEPGGTKKGCSVDDQAPSGRGLGALAGLLMLLGFKRRKQA